MCVTGRETQPQEVGKERRELIDSGFSKEAGRGGAGPSQDTSLRRAGVHASSEQRDQEGRKM